MATLEGTLSVTGVATVVFAGTRRPTSVWTVAGSASFVATPTTPTMSHPAHVNLRASAAFLAVAVGVTPAVAVFGGNATFFAKPTLPVTHTAAWG